MGTATTEMKITMIHTIDAAMEVYVNVEPTLFVDDVSAESVAADEETMVNELVGFTHLVGHAIMDSQMELSDVKCKCNASTNALGKKSKWALRSSRLPTKRKSSRWGPAWQEEYVGTRTSNRAASRNLRNGQINSGG